MSPGDTRALDVLRELRVAYDSCTSYVDKGTIAIDGCTVGTFATEFRRAGAELHFRYWANETTWAEYFVQAGKVATYEMDAQTLQSALRRGVDRESIVAFLSGVTFGAACGIPELLVGQAVAGRPFLGANHPEVLGESSVDGIDCVWLKPDERREEYMAVAVHERPIVRVLNGTPPNMGTVGTDHPNAYGGVSLSYLPKFGF